MPGSGQWVELCTVHGTILVQVELPSSDADDASDDTQAQSCPWSAYLCGLDPLNFWSQVLLPTSSSPPDIVGHTPLHQRLAVALPPLRGPPLDLVSLK